VYHDIQMGFHQRFEGLRLCAYILENEDNLFPQYSLLIMPEISWG
jgi:hypothetical protein